MPWFRVDDSFAFNPKVIKAEEKAPGSMSAWVRMGSYCAANLTDGLVPFLVARTVASPSQLDVLVSVRFVYLEDDGYRIHDYLKYQPSKQEVEQDRADARDRMRNRRNKKTDVRPNTPQRTSEEVLDGMGWDLKSESDSELPGNPTEATKRVVDRWRPVAETVLDALNAARRRVHSKSRGITTTYDSLKHIADRLEAGKSVEDCLHVVEVYEAECRDDAGSFKWFDQVTPFRPENFERKCAADPSFVSGVSAAKAKSDPPRKRMKTAEEIIAERAGRG